MMLGLGLAIQTYHVSFRMQLPIYATKPICTVIAADLISYPG
jgi:hypothetical protein